MSAKLDVSLNDLIKSQKPARTSKPKTVKTGAKPRRASASRPATSSRPQSTSRGVRTRSTRPSSRSPIRSSSRSISRSTLRSSRPEHSYRSSAPRASSRDYRNSREPSRDYRESREHYRDYHDPRERTTVPSVSIKSNEPALCPEDTVMLSNLRSFITEAHIRDNIFHESGDIKSVNMVHDSQGNPIGSAIVVFYDTKDATKAVKDFDGAVINGTPMSAKLISSLRPESGNISSYHKDSRDFDYGHDDRAHYSRDRSPRRDERDYGYNDRHRSVRRSPVREHYRSSNNDSHRRSPAMRSTRPPSRRSNSREHVRDSRSSRHVSSQKSSSYKSSKPSTDSLDAELDAYNASREDEAENGAQ